VRLADLGVTPEPAEAWPPQMQATKLRWIQTETLPEDRRGSMENATFRKWLADQGCNFDTQREKRVMCTINIDHVAPELCVFYKVQLFIFPLCQWKEF
jgi:hypothetical protein